MVSPYYSGVMFLVPDHGESPGAQHTLRRSRYMDTGQLLRMCYAGVGTVVIGHWPLTIGSILALPAGLTMLCFLLCTW